MRSSDAAGIGLSALCLVHCLGLPVLIAISPALVWMEDERVHILLAISAFAVTVIAASGWPGILRKPLMYLAALAGLALLFAGALIEMSEVQERVITTIGALFLASAHLNSWMRTRERHAEHQGPAA